MSAMRWSLGRRCDRGFEPAPKTKAIASNTPGFRTWAESWAPRPLTTVVVRSKASLGRFMPASRTGCCRLTTEVAALLVAAVRRRGAAVTTSARGLRPFRYRLLLTTPNVAESPSEDPFASRRIYGRHRGPEAELMGDGRVHATRPRIGQGLCRSLERVAGELGRLVDGDRSVVGDVDDPPVHRSGKGDVDRGHDVAVVGHGVGVRGVQPEARGERRDHG